MGREDIHCRCTVTAGKLKGETPKKILDSDDLKSTDVSTSGEVIPAAELMINQQNKADEIKNFRNPRGAQFDLLDLATWLDPKLTREERQALEQYSTSLFHDLNSGLRLGKTTEKSLLIDEVFRKAPKLKADLKVYRGLDQSAFPGKRLPVIGDVIIDQAFMSTTISSEVAEGFARGVTLEMIAKKGSTPLSLVRVNPSAESELLFPRGTRLLIHEVVVDPNTEDVRIIAEIVS